MEKAMLRNVDEKCYAAPEILTNQALNIYRPLDKSE